MNIVIALLLVLIAYLGITVFKQSLTIKFFKKKFNGLYYGEENKIERLEWFLKNEKHVVTAYNRLIDRQKDINFTAKSHERLYKISYLINNMKFSELLFDEVIKILTELFDAEKGSIMLKNDVLELQVIGAIGMQQSIREKTRVKKGEGISGTVLLTGEGIYAKDIEKDLNIKKNKTYVTPSFISAPLKHRDEIIGVINISERRQKSLTFDEKDLQLLTIIGIQLGMLIKNKQMNDDRLQSSRIETIGLMASSIVHEIRNSVTGIKGLLQLYKSKYGKSFDNKGKEYFSVIEKELLRIDELNSEILEYSSGIKVDRQKNELNELLYEVEKLYRIKIEKTGDITSEEILYFDKDKIKEVLLNLIKNAYEAKQDRENFEVTVCLDKTDKKYFIKVQDNGAGMSQEIASKVFEPFFSTKKKGTGLGLAICKQIVEAHNGDLSLHSIQGIGTEFLMVLPKQ